MTAPSRKNSRIYIFTPSLLQWVTAQRTEPSPNTKSSSSTSTAHYRLGNRIYDALKRYLLAAARPSRPPRKRCSRRSQGRDRPSDAFPHHALCRLSLGCTRSRGAPARQPKPPDAAPPGDAAIGTSAQPVAETHTSHSGRASRAGRPSQTPSPHSPRSHHSSSSSCCPTSTARPSRTRSASSRGPCRPNFTFTAVYTAEDAGVYKPAPGALAYALTRLKEDFGVEKEEVLVTAQSLFHDVIPAKARGIDAAWIAREGGVTGLQGTTGEEAKFKFKTLGEMAEAVKKDRAA
ncbi:hypothetical protein A0H81_06384 [Grifola frondosa]|uniref:Uncharacterized protein n=1 Tax=Grifola frondosa TaxID=5627 RepID=A0A1C7MAD0_GRIFR|nr:hypothetical protein A0H81_06384 [Grifola frondosa]